MIIAEDNNYRIVISFISVMEPFKGPNLEIFDLAFLHH